ncbi:MAG: hypothetical protein ACOX51_00605 [Myxococcota bacterium]|nr:hypothetical protein [Myxococcota bacterium]
MNAGSKAAKTADHNAIEHLGINARARAHMAGIVKDEITSWVASTVVFVFGKMANKGVKNAHGPLPCRSAPFKGPARILPK